MTEVKILPLGELCDPGRGITYGIVKVGDFVPNGVPVIRGGDIRENRIVFDNEKRVTREVSEQFSRTILRGGELVINLIAEPGHSAIVPREMAGFNVSRDVAVIPLDETVNHAYVNWYLKSSAAIEWLTARLSGSVTQKINIGVLREVPVPLPERRYQDSVAALMEALDEKMAINDRIGSAYEQLLQCKFAKLGLADEPDEETAIPVTDLVTFNPKMVRPSSGEPIYVDMAALRTSRAVIPSWSRRAPKSGPRFRNGDTLLARITPCLENGKTGYVDFMEDGEIGLGSTEFIVMRSAPGVPSHLSYFLARDARFREHAIRNMVGSSGRQRVSAADAANYRVNRPEVHALVEFGNDAEVAFKHMKSLAAESRTLAVLRDTLLPQLMSGKLRVRDAERIVEDAV
ncbi:restriction endonuclease subunit S [Streptomyces sp. NPDC058667]|uniref:restriction endonuclease subunit S n=1 Tax=Streptomyces sp. NPDC058667 TaxID=3346588 RepID=UPI0036641949